METEYSINEDDCVKSAKLGATATRKQLVRFGYVGFGLLLLGVFGPGSMKGVGYFGIAGTILGYLLTVHVICPWQARKNFRNYKGIQKPLKLRLIQNGFTIKTQNGVSNAKWENLLKWRESKDIILVYFAPKMYYLIPKRISDKGFDIESFRQLLREKLGAAETTL
jgi:hypothetical protein